MNINISHLSVLNKIEEEIRQAKSAEKDSAMKQHVYTVRTLCDMLLDTPDTGGAGAAFAESMPLRQAVPQQPVVGRSEKLNTDDGANGDSIFDF
ncbi:hypothetical protein F9802_07145 [Bacillus aerolatus]|uniref:YwdI family protein n=1 Tax=Bacillus aerolatus TaxID=2653354 RepID=A0A6I1FL11_9BACI|nr:YwdI family protein [Bacillus aerolatus]KAB7707518.1 hypothetical protein F9802_07145 [Bacillus aerolatus]